MFAGGGVGNWKYSFHFYVRRVSLGSKGTFHIQDSQGTLLRLIHFGKT